MNIKYHPDDFVEESMENPNNDSFYPMILICLICAYFTIKYLASLTDEDLRNSRFGDLIEEKVEFSSLLEKIKKIQLNNGTRQRFVVNLTKTDNITNFTFDIVDNVGSNDKLAKFIFDKNV